MKLTLPSSLRSRTTAAPASIPGPAPVPRPSSPLPRPRRVRWPLCPHPSPLPARAPRTSSRPPRRRRPAVLGQVLPIYFVADESHSMRGAPIAAVNQGLLDLRDEVARHPLIGKKVQFAIITFADTAEIRLSSPSSARS